ncbi:MAG TPA: beta-N-acetylhexosaminidase [Longimicrobiaceae bacterium]|nr:beta-N-acetylhexosaminidase [Longimicrobiaceae bacterium]
MRPLAALLCGALLSAGCTDLVSHGRDDPALEWARRYPVVPAPATLRPARGEFVLDGSTRLLLADPADPEVRSVAELLAAPLRAASGFPLPVSAAPASGPERNALVLRLAAELPGDSPERYRLSVTEQGAVLAAATPAGLFRGTQTLRQLLPPAVEEAVRARADWRGIAPARASTGRARWAVPAVEIEDAPRFAYRGMHLDVARHFMPPEFVKKYVDLLALYRFSHFHWHLTDDQGWRIEIRKHPRLTEVGAWRRETMVGRLGAAAGDGRPHGGFYTQAEVRDIVAYAAARHVTIVPEIEMPGHARAAIAAYPELSCSGAPVEVATGWGIHADVLCPSERTFAFLEDVLDEVMELFPGPYVHVGGDEVRKEQWAESPVAREVMRREGLAGVEALQTYFVGRVGRYLEAQGRRYVGWDEIAQGGIPPGAVVMSWRGMLPGIDAARRGHEVIMAPDTHLYFDHYQANPASEPLGIGNVIPLRVVYDFDPVPPDLGPGERERVLGGQGSVWTEHLRTPGEVEYMAFPRVIALSEALWTPVERRSWKSFQERLPAQLRRLDALGVRYRAP